MSSANIRGVTETQLNGAPPPAAAEPAASSGRANVAVKTAIWTGVALGAAATATIAFFVLRAMQKRPPDETSERIQGLIDEANRLIRTLEEKK